MSTHFLSVVDSDSSLDFRDLFKEEEEKHDN